MLDQESLTWLFLFYAAGQLSAFISKPHCLYKIPLGNRDAWYLASNKGQTCLSYAPAKLFQVSKKSLWKNTMFTMENGFSFLWLWGGGGGRETGGRRREGGTGKHRFVNSPGAPATRCFDSHPMCRLNLVTTRMIDPTLQTGN